MRAVKQKYLQWSKALVLMAVVAACSDDIASVGVSPTSPGAGPGTGVSGAHGPTPVVLGTASQLDCACSYVILAKTAIANVPSSVITGHLGIKPNFAVGITGFGSLPLDASGQFSTDVAQVTGNIYAVDYTAPTPVNVTTAVSNMEAAYTDAAGRTLPDHTELASGNIGGLTLPPGLYKWSNTVLIPTNVTLSGGANDTWIFQIAGDLTQSSAARVILSGGALAKNIVWQVAGIVTINTTAHMEGRILSQTQIILRTGATANGKLLAQTQVVLDANTVVDK